MKLWFLYVWLHYVLPLATEAQNVLEGALLASIACCDVRLSQEDLRLSFVLKIEFLAA